jgi:hypothetical protein
MAVENIRKALAVNDNLPECHYNMVSPCNSCGASISP